MDPIVDSLIVVRFADFAIDVVEIVMTTVFVASVVDDGAVVFVFAAVVEDDCDDFAAVTRLAITVASNVMKFVAVAVAAVPDDADYAIIAIDVLWVMLWLTYAGRCYALAMMLSMKLSNVVVQKQPSSLVN